MNEQSPDPDDLGHVAAAARAIDELSDVQYEFELVLVPSFSATGHLYRLLVITNDASQVDRFMREVVHPWGVDTDSTEEIPGLPAPVTRPASIEEIVLGILEIDRDTLCEQLDEAARALFDLCELGLALVGPDWDEHTAELQALTTALTIGSDFDIPAFGDNDWEYALEHRFRRDLPLLQFIRV